MHCLRRASHHNEQRWCAGANLQFKQLRDLHAYTALRELNLHANQIESIHPTYLAPMRGLVTLNLSSNRLTALQGEPCPRPSRLTRATPALARADTQGWRR
jgi:Leucine-rich repeat (LRR) protein